MKRLPFVLVLIVYFLLVGCGDAWSPTTYPPEKPTGESPARAACVISWNACPADEHCDPYRGCVECLLDAHCAAGSRCIDRKCGPAASCSDSSECEGTREVCALSSGLCVPCLSDADCPRGGRCEERQCKPKEACAESSDCEEGKVCDGAECVQCVVDADCAAGSNCVDGTCSRHCEQDGECSSLNQVCDLRANHCVACVVDCECPSSHHCAAGTCVIDVCEPGVVRCIDATSYVRCEKDGFAATAGFCRGLSRCDGKNTDGPC